MDNRERMQRGLLYDPSTGDVMDEQLALLDKMVEYNNTLPREQERRTALLKELFGAVGEGCYIEAPYRANWGGKHVFMGNHVYANFNLTLVDDANIYIGNDVMFAPNVVVATAGHPIDPELRARGLQYNKEVRIGNNVWVGAGALIMPGVTIGDNSVIGAGSVVTKDIPANVVAVGNPCKVMRPIGERDKIYFYRDEKIDI
ncbi:MAG: sugar O-acetyltransferase [Clostridia bacterium]|nr:sugar O-acetyltransferase [Clostridia bacterium]MBO7156353.1 sugar O-acetyltransferase [Clostridia bacterium]